MHYFDSSVHYVRDFVWPKLQRTNFAEPAILLIGIALAVVVRLPLLDFRSLDFYASLQPWYSAIQSQGFPVFATNFSTYNPPYLYLLYLISRLLPSIPIVVAVKLPALAADFVCAYLVARIVQIARPSGLTAFLAGLAVLFAPSVVLNSAFWGQADSLFTAGLLACVYFLMVRKYAWGLVFFGIALSFKLQAIFLAPVLFAFFLSGTISWKYFLAVPAILILALVPAWIAGRPPQELLNIYLYQASQFEAITMNAASIYTWLPGSKQVFNLFYVPGVILGLSAAFLLTVLIYKAPRRISRGATLELSLLAMLIVPFFLPKMHDRYFYPADLLAIAFAFYYPAMFYVPVLVVGVSVLSYGPFLFQVEALPFPVLTLVQLGVISMLTYHAIRALYRTPKSPADVPEISTAELAGLETDKGPLA